MRRIPALLACAAIGLALAIADSTPSRATIASPTSSVVASGNGSTTTFAYGFIIPYQSNGTTPAVSAYLTNTTTSAVTPLAAETRTRGRPRPRSPSKSRGASACRTARLAW